MNNWLGNGVTWRHVKENIVGGWGGLSEKDCGEMSDLSDVVVSRFCGLAGWQPAACFLGLAKRMSNAQKYAKTFRGTHALRPFHMRCDRSKMAKKVATRR